MDRKWQFHRLQMIGVPLLLSIPVVALTGQLGGARERREVHEDGVVVALEYSTRDHFEDWSRLELTVRNASPTELPEVRAEFTRGLVDAFARPQFQPPLVRIDDLSYVVALGPIAAGAARTVVLDYQPAAFGRLSGAVHVRAGDRELAQLPVALVVLP